jgi:transposase
MVQKRQRKDYTPDFKNDAIKLVTEQGYSCTEAGRRLGVNHSNISRWIREQKQDKQDLAENGIPRRELEAENRQLKKENKRLLMEREILKKAAAFFANESK